MLTTIRGVVRWLRGHRRWAAAGLAALLVVSLVAVSVVARRTAEPTDTVTAPADTGTTGSDTTVTTTPPTTGSTAPSTPPSTSPQGTASTPRTAWSADAAAPRPAAVSAAR